MEDLMKETIQVEAAGIGKVPVDGHVLRQRNPRILLIQDRLVTITANGEIVATLDLLKVFNSSGRLIQSISDVINPPNIKGDGQ